MACISFVLCDHLLTLDSGEVYGSTLVDKAFQRFFQDLAGEGTIKFLANTEKDMKLHEFIEVKETFDDALMERKGNFEGSTHGHMVCMQYYLCLQD